MAETITIDGQRYLKRNPIGVLGLSIVTLGVYFFYWYYQVNDELRRFERDESISPARSLVAVLFGWMIIVPPFIAFYNTAKHVQAVEQRQSIQPELEPALVIVILLLVAVANGVYMQEHLNRIWDRSSEIGAALPPSPAATPSTLLGDASIPPPPSR
jgi:Domain of unknown function (DUF4234)